MFDAKDIMYSNCISQLHILPNKEKRKMTFNLSSRVYGALWFVNEISSTYQKAQKHH